jgi:hypothetical protein
MFLLLGPNLAQERNARLSLIRAKPLQEEEKLDECTLEDLFQRSRHNGDDYAGGFGARESSSQLD